METYKDDASAMDRPLKRKRITMACHRCRQKKGKCDGTKPICGNCATSRTLCEWPDPEQDGRKHKKSVKSKVEPVEHDELAMDSDNQRRSPYPRSHHTLESPSLRHDVPRYSSMASPPRRDESISAPHPSAHPHPHPHNQSALDILLAAALPGHHNEPQASSSRLPGSGSQSSHDQHSLVTPTLESERKSASQSHDPPLVLQYHRAFGPTAIQPGLEQISIAFRAPPPGSRCASPTPPGVSPLLPQHQGPPDPYNLTGSTPFSFEPIHYINPLSAIYNGEAPSPVGNPSTSYLPDSLYDIDSDIPRPSVLQRLLPLFFTRMGSHFPFLTESRVMGNIDHEDPSKRVTAPLLINTVCALASRFSDVPIVRSQHDRSPATYGIPFAEKSKQLLVPLLGYPSSNTVAALLFLAYFSFGLNSEGALWTYSGMALRMAVDLGLHQDIACRAVPSSPIQQYEDRLLWWSCFLLDRILAFGTGRPVTVKDKEITTPLPTEAEMTAVREFHVTFPEKGIEASSSQTPSPFPYFVRMFKMYGELAEVINTVETTWLPPVSEPPSRGEQPTSEEAAQQPSTHPESSVDLCEVEDAITSVYNSLPDSMTFSSENLQAHASNMEGPVFLALHLWYNCIVIFLYRPPLIHPKVNAARASLQDRLAVVNNACQMISSVITSADLVDPFSYLASPFVNQCLFVAASAWVQDYRIRTGRVLLANTAPSEKTSKNVLNASTNILAQVAMNNFKLCKRALNRQTAYWMGVKWIEAVVEKYASQKRRASLKNATEGVDTFVSGAEMAIFRRLVQRTTGASPSSEFSAEALSALFSAFSQGQDSSVSLSEDDWALAYSFASMTAANDSRYDMNAFA